MNNKADNFTKNTTNINVRSSNETVNRVGFAANRQLGHPYHILPPSFFPPLMSLLVLFLGLSVIITVRGNFGVLLDPVYVFSLMEIETIKEIGWSFFRSFRAILASILWEDLVSILVILSPPLVAAMFLALPSAVLTWIGLAASEELEGFHTVEVQNGFRLGIVLFIVSEVILFFAFFWAFFHAGLTNNIFGNIFPPEGIRAFDWWQIPLLNTLVLLSSGLSISLAHEIISCQEAGKRAKNWWRLFLMAAYSDEKPHEFGSKRLRNETNLGSVLETVDTETILGFEYEQSNWFDRESYFYVTVEGAGFADFCIHGECDVLADPLVVAVEFLSIRRQNSPSVYDILQVTIDNKTFNIRGEILVMDTLIRGLVFVLLQALEYISSPFCMNDSAYGSAFFTLTALHGSHVIIGAIVLAAVVAYDTDRRFFENEFGEESISYHTWFDKLADIVCLPRSLNREEPLPLAPLYRYELVYWSHRVGFDGAVWYWHFVDVVWLFVFLFVYWWATRIFPPLPPTNLMPPHWNLYAINKLEHEFVCAECGYVNRDRLWILIVAHDLGYNYFSEIRARQFLGFFGPPRKPLPWPPVPEWYYDILIDRILQGYEQRYAAIQAIAMGQAGIPITDEVIAKLNIPVCRCTKRDYSQWLFTGKIS